MAEEPVPLKAQIEASTAEDVARARVLRQPRDRALQEIERELNGAIQRRALRAAKVLIRGVGKEAQW